MYEQNKELAKNFGFIFYKCFNRYFVLVNVWEEKLEKSNVLRAKEIEGLYGLESLWEISLICSHEKLKEEFIQFLVSLYLYLSESLQPERIKIWNGFVDKVRIRLNEAENVNENSLILSLINLLLTFFRTLDGDKYYTESLEQIQRTNKLNITAIIKPGML